MNRIEELVSLIKSKSAFKFNISIALIIASLIVIPLVGTLWIQLILGVLILVVLIPFIGMIKERNRLNDILKHYQEDPEQSLAILEKHMQKVKTRLHGDQDINENPNQQNKNTKQKREMQKYQQLKNAIKEKHPNL